MSEINIRNAEIPYLYSNQDDASLERLDPKATTMSYYPIDLKHESQAKGKSLFLSLSQMTSYASLKLN